MRQVADFRPVFLDHANAVARLHQLIDQMAADEARAAVTIVSPFMIAVHPMNRQARIERPL